MQKTVTKVLYIPDENVPEAKQALINFYDPRSMLHMDSYHLSSIERRYGMTIAELESMIGRPKFNMEAKWEYDA